MSALDDVSAQEQNKLRKKLWAGSEDVDYAAEDTKDLSTCGESGEGEWHGMAKMSEDRESNWSKGNAEQKLMRSNQSCQNGEPFKVSELKKPLMKQCF